MSFEIQIQFGGLCMLVRGEDQNKKPALHVLMPKMQHMGEDHCQLVMFHGDNTSDKKYWRQGMASESIDLRTIPPGQTRPYPDGILAISRYAMKPVNTVWLDVSAKPSKCLAARVSLPVHAAIQMVGEPGDLFVPGANRVQPFYGQLLTTFDYDGADVEVFGRRLTPTDGVVKLKMVNTPFATLDGLRRESVFGTPSMHAQGYYSLLADYCDKGTSGPAILKAESWKQGAGAGAPDECRNAPVETPSWEIDDGHFIDPLNCTVGYGCPEPDFGCV